ncbi:aminotransferase class I/II-fold pyridoxal phosphate-dependent enzyme [Streptomyces sp. B21-105]|uniref:aminotransferase class I/II-fold pyridoxal phosphate-dependent enzyme n=1 Tax=Streptomyces sp. B21-105 TaxID=3039417 RepID=UPI002FF2E397
MTGRLGTPAGSPILEMARRAAEYRAQGRHIVDLTLGEPDFAPPGHVIAAAQEAAGRVLGYSPANGLPELRRAVRHAVQRDRGLEYADAQVAVGCGAKQVIFNAFFATLRPGDEVIVPVPYWASYPDMIRLCGGLPVVVGCPAESGFRLTPQALRAAITELPQGILAERRAIYLRRRDAALAILCQSPRLDTVAPDGAFYLFPRLVTGDDLAVADALLEAGCATVPGSAFGAPDHLRLCFATDITTLQAGCRTVVAVLDEVAS